MNDWFWLKVNLLSTPKYTITDTSSSNQLIKKCSFPKLYAITKIVIANQILYDGLNKIKDERRYHSPSRMSTYYSSCDEVVNIEKKALILYKEAAFLGCPIAFAIIGYYYENGLAGLPINYYKAERYYTLGLGYNNKLINKKNNKSIVGLSLIRLSFLKQYGRPGIIINQCISKKYKKQAKSLGGGDITLNWIISLAKLEHISSLFIVASSYYNGLGVERDVEKAYHYAKIAAEYGHPGAQNLVGMINYEGTETLEKNEEMALRWYRKAAKSNEAAALYNLAMLYENGAVVMQNYNEAFKYYKMASDLGSISGTNIIGFFYEHGIGTEKDKISSFKYYLKAASKGSPFGQYNLGRCFLYGIGIKRNITSAIKWFELAGIQGHSNSYLTLAVIYDMGIKVCQNNRLARKYYTLAYRNNMKSVSKRLMAGIAIDILRVSRFLLSPSSATKSTNKYLKSLHSEFLNIHGNNSNDTLFVNSFSQDNLNLLCHSNSLLTILLNNNNNNNINNSINTINTINDNEEEEQINWTSTSQKSKNDNNTFSIIEKDYSSSYLSHATSSSSLITLNNIEELEEDKEKEEKNQSMLGNPLNSSNSSSSSIEDIMEYIQEFESSANTNSTITTTTTTTTTSKKRNHLLELPNELKYSIINTLNPDNILSSEIMNKIFQYVIHGEQNFKTKTEFLNYLEIKEFKLEETNNYHNTEERINGLIEQLHQNN